MKYLKKIIKLRVVLLIAIVTWLYPILSFSQQKSVDTQNPPQVVEFMGTQPMTRVGRPFVVLASIFNPKKTPIDIDVELLPTEHIHIINPDRKISLRPGEKVSVKWKLNADKPLYKKLQLEVKNDDAIISAAQLPVRFLPAMRKTIQSYVPKPVIPVKRDKNLLIGAHYFPGWEKGQPEMWNQVLLKHPERTPALGFYDGGIPEVADWETRWAVEHGIDFFIYCWYRASQGGPVEQNLGSQLKARNKSKFQNLMKFTIMWENQKKGVAGVADEQDLMQNLMPFWINKYFKRKNYLKVDNKPVLFIYRPEFLIEDLGSIEKVHDAFNKMRQACRDAGFDGLWLLGEYRGHDPKHLELMKSLGLDYTFAYCWYVSNSPDPQQAIDSQLTQIRKTKDLDILPQVVTVSQGWSGWRDEGTIWSIPPIEYETLLRQAKSFVKNLPKNQLSGRMLLLDNWNEWSEGHYIAPCTEYGFGYLDAIRKVFLDSNFQHKDLIPEDVENRSFETAYRKWLRVQRNK